jgi:hypothetical protein
MFQPRRTAFVYEMESEDGWGTSDVPVTLRRSKADCPPAKVTCCSDAGARVAPGRSLLPGSCLPRHGAARSCGRAVQQGLA